MNKRIKEVRLSKNLTQEKFANIINLKQNTIALIESGKRNPSDRTISDICQKFGVNEVWLRTGEGGEENMFTKVDENDKFSLNLGKLSITENQTAKNMLNAIAEASPEKLKHIEEFMKACLGIK
ncbi:helix-turn-helix domain-containing protein [Ruminococcus sp. OA3]|uniref:helix-turn-helix domain-containing protein n=1 Tax=Ruminococcus sp. OA3 TaxID=2914164 RepID=UPI001F05698D|nr:helix-turn-helix transcriptional regulator [Ruminococcus sp. OA3]MCH1984191.1 helix-turn-helix domain-containing protein [Ruminococcus sp. OA3]